MVAKAVNHQARQQVGLAVHQTIEGLVEQALTQAQRHLEAVHQQRLVEQVSGIATKQARTDQVVGADAHQAQGLAAAGFELRLLAGLEGSQRRLRGIHFITEDPQVPCADAPFGIGFETQTGQ